MRSILIHLWQLDCAFNLQYKKSYFLETWVQALFMNSSTSGARSLKSWLTCLSMETSVAAVRRSPCAHASRSYSGKMIFLASTFQGRQMQGRDTMISWPKLSKEIWKSNFRQYGQMEKQRWEGSEKRKKEEDQRRKRQKTEGPGARKGRKVAKAVFFQCCEAPEDRKVGSLKRRVRSQLARWEIKNCTPLRREFQVKMYKTPRLRNTFKNCDVEKVHVVVARSTCPSQNVQNTACSDHFWKLRCRKSARCCGTKHMSKSKCTKHLSERFWKLRCRKVHADAARGRCSTRDIFIRDVGRSGFRKVAFLSIRCSGLLWWFWVTGAALRMTWLHLLWQALRETFHFWRKSRKNCFVFDVVTFKTWGSLAEFRRFGPVSFHCVRKSRRISSLWSCELSFCKEVWQNCFNLELSTSTLEGSLAEMVPCR